MSEINTSEDQGLQNATEYIAWLEAYIKRLESIVFCVAKAPVVSLSGDVCISENVVSRARDALKLLSGEDTPVHLLN